MYVHLNRIVKLDVVRGYLSIKVGSWSSKYDAILSYCKGKDHASLIPLYLSACLGHTQQNEALPTPI